MPNIMNSFVRSQYFADQYSRNRIIRDLDVGLSALRNSKDIVTFSGNETPYLPKFDKEPAEFYRLRVARTFLTNYWKRTITSDSGKILANNVMISIDGKPNDEIPEPFLSWTKNITMSGDNLTMMIHGQLQKAMKKGLVLCFADYDSQAQRPYTREIDIDSVLAFKCNPRTGALSYLKFNIDYVKDSEDLETNLEKAVFEIFPTAWSITMPNGTLAEEGEIIRYKNGRERITDEIPVAVFYTNKLGVLLSESPYQTLAELTIEHFQVYSDIKNMMFYALTPILTAKNVPADFTLQMLASYMMVKMPETGDKEPSLEWTQVDAAAIQEGQKQLDAIERRISTFSIDSNALRPGTLTATQSSIESQGTNAALRAFAVALSEHVQNILELMVSYTLQSGVEIKGYIAPEFNSLESDKEMRVLMEMRRNQDISSDSIVDAAIQRKLLPPDFDREKNRDALVKELDDMMKYEDAKAALKKKSDTAQQASEGLLAGSGNETVTDKPRDA